MKLEKTELETIKRLMRKKDEHPEDIFAKEELNQYMKDIAYKYKIILYKYKINMETGDLIEI